MGQWPSVCTLWGIFKHRANPEAMAYWSLLRIASYSVCDVEVKLITMEPQVNVVIPAILHRMGDHTIKFLESYQTKTDVHPGNPQYFDVIGKLQSDELFIFYADKLLPFKLPIRDGTDQYKFTILVSGRDIPARARNFKTYIDSNQQFIMEPEGESYEPKF
jgi:hypothetical protein